MRQCFITPIPEIELAAKLFDAAADALILGDKPLAGSLIAKADIPSIMEYAVRIVGKLSMEVHRRTKLPNTIPKDSRDCNRMPTESVQRTMFERDGWRCRYCGIKVLSRRARGVLIKTFPTETRWTHPEFKRHAALYVMAASLDHIVPHSRGGRNDPENFVTACYCCQFGRGQWLLEEVELADPRDRIPIAGDWDGLTRIERIGVAETI